MIDQRIQVRSDLLVQRFAEVWLHLWVGQSQTQISLSTRDIAFLQVILENGVVGTCMCEGDERVYRVNQVPWDLAAHTWRCPSCGYPLR